MFLWIRIESFERTMWTVATAFQRLVAADPTAIAVRLPGPPRVDLTRQWVWDRAAAVASVVVLTKPRSSARRPWVLGVKFDDANRQMYVPAVVGASLAGATA